MSERIEIGPYDYSDHFFKRAALLVSMGKDRTPNVMALQWKTIGELWMIPVITAAVAPSRYSFSLLTEGIREFTINIPSDQNANAINITGTSSGRNTDKFKKAGLELIDGTKTTVPTIKNCDLNYECKIVHQAESGSMASHHLFFGEILAAFASKRLL
ncbi:MAG: hypothetical protein GF383_15820 [Candidatus Lokiarchaeota archaeon]|nr:hypothetical protein [Candidatus Lokiarchaeota archaeon]MBD3343168.1 hypothetical protein [Candidatus Lokiarchaeota archaeon]